MHCFNSVTSLKCCVSGRNCTDLLFSPYKNDNKNNLVIQLLELKLLKSKLDLKNYSIYSESPFSHKSVLFLK